MKFIPLSQTYKCKLSTLKLFVKVDDADFESLSKHNWQAWRSRKDSTYYAVRNVKDENGKRRIVLMHREIMNASKNQMVDHANRDGLDCQCLNLRFCNHSESNINKRSHKDSSSKYIGVSWFRRDGKWKAQICLDHKNRHIGYYINEIDAAKAYNEKAKELHGEFATINAIP